MSYWFWKSPDIAIDLGSSTVRIAVAGEGLVVEEPAVVALNKQTGQILGQGTAIGRIARHMVGRTPETIEAVFPIRHGVITEFQLCEQMLKHLITKALGSSVKRPRTLVAVPASLTQVERRAVLTTLDRAGLGKVYLMEQSRVAGIGSGLPVSEPVANVVCDLGGGTTEIAVMSLGGIVSGSSLRIAGEELDQAIVSMLRKNYSMRISHQFAQQVKHQAGSASALREEQQIEVRGIDSISGMARKAIVTTEEIREALSEPLHKIANEIKETIERCGPQLVADVAQSGMTLTGAGALLTGMDRYLEEALSIPVTIAISPQQTVVRGLQVCLEHFELWKNVFEQERQAA